MFYNMELSIDEQSEMDMEMEMQEFDPLKTPYEVDEHDFPGNGSLREQYAFLLKYAVLAPSVDNTQPWKFKLHEAGISVYADYGRRLRVADPANRELLMSVGAAIMNIRVAAARFGFACDVHYNQSGDSEEPLAFLALSPGRPLVDGDPSLRGLFGMIVKRRTNRNPFLLSRIPEVILGKFEAVANGLHTSALISTDGAVNREVADLVAAAVELQQRDPEFRKELSEWVRTNWTRKADGMLGAAFGVNDVNSLVAPWATKTFDLGRIRATNDRNLCSLAPGLIVLYSEDSVPAWLEVGEILENLLLTITREGLQYGFFNMPIEVPELRVELRARLGLPSWPQLLLRIGYCLKESARSPRRPVEEVLIRERL